MSMLVATPHPAIQRSCSANRTTPCACPSVRVAGASTPSTSASVNNPSPSLPVKADGGGEVSAPCRRLGRGTRVVSDQRDPPIPVSGRIIVTHPLQQHEAG